ncbi:DUF4392 domain-containing protein [Lachnospiraceae bacterium C1.1]|nr:DUF4392 domain-containing protein [Lachnospiraceae bacterium C1.1]
MSEAKSIEEIILKYSSRGMNILKDHLPKDYCSIAANEILSWKKGNVVLATGFYVAGFAETDGPAGTVVLGRALKKLGYDPVIVTDEYCRNFFEDEDFKVRYLDLNADSESCRELLKELDPVGMISIERCGKNIEGKYANMRGVDIGEHTAPVDELFRLAFGEIPTIGIGDGGNEIGMGNLKETISNELSLTPCEVKTDILLIASVSNWGAYALAAALSEKTGQDLMTSSEETEAYIGKTVEMGSVDGVSHEHKVSVDGNDISIEMEIIDELIGSMKITA